MTIESWAAFVAASMILLAIPGPTVTLVVGYAMGRGQKAALARPPTARLVNRLGGGALIGASVLAATARDSR